MDFRRNYRQRLGTGCQQGASRALGGSSSSSIHICCPELKLLHAQLHSQGSSELMMQESSGV